MTNCPRCSNPCHLASEAEKQKLEKMYEVALRNREFELQIFWQRLLFFVGFLASILVALTADGIKDDLFFKFLLSAAGAVVSFFFIKTINTVKYWSENWETKVAKLEERLGYSFNNERISETKADGCLKDQKDVKTCLLTSSIFFSEHVGKEKPFSMTKILNWLAVSSMVFFILEIFRTSYDAKFFANLYFYLVHSIFC